MQVHVKTYDVVKDYTGDKKMHKKGMDDGTEDDSKENTEDTSLEDVKKSVRIEMLAQQYH